MLIVSIDSSLGSRLLVCEAAGPAAHAPVRLEVLADAEQADSRRHAESLGPMLAGALADPAVADRAIILRPPHTSSAELCARCSPATYRMLPASVRTQTSRTMPWAS